VTPALRGVDGVRWAQENRDWIEAELHRAGAVLFRGFELGGTAGASAFMQAISGELMEYRERSSPRHAVAERVYTSTDYPPDQPIFPHNEHSYSLTVPQHLYFTCAVPPERGGETPLADCRKVRARLAPEVRERFREKRWMYVRNLDGRFGLPWPVVFQTEDRAEVEAYCRAQDIEIEWRADGGLRTRQVRPAELVHPQTGEGAWFNHITFFHVTTLPPFIRERLLGELREDDLPNNTYYGDGSAIEAETLDALRAAYRDECVMFPWQRGDVLLIDNILTAHARQPFRGPRQIHAAMARPFRRERF